MAAAEWLTIFQQGMGKRRSQRTGYLYQKGGYWYLQYRVDSNEIDPLTGKRIRSKVTVQIGAISKGKNSDGLGTREARREAWNRYLSSVDVMSRRPGSSITLAQFVEHRWRPDRIAHLSPKGRVHYETQLKNHILPALGGRPLRDIGLAQVQELMNQKVASKKLAPASLQAILGTLRALFNHAKRMDCITILPTDGVRLPRVREKEKQALTWKQVETIAAALPEPVATLVLFLTWTGLRIGEACGLRWRDVDLESLTIHVRENYVMGKYQDLKTRKSRRDVPIPKELAERLANLWVDAISPASHEDMPVFANGRGSGPIDHHNVANRVLKPTVKTLGLPWVSWHTFRRTTATLMDQVGLSMAERQKVMGHTTAAMTMHYTRPEMEGIRGRMAEMTGKKPN